VAHSLKLEQFFLKTRTACFLETNLMGEIDLLVLQIPIQVGSGRMLLPLF